MKIKIFISLIVFSSQVFCASEAENGKKDVVVKGLMALLVEQTIKRYPETGRSDVRITQVKQLLSCWSTKEHLVSKGMQRILLARFLQVQKKDEEHSSAPITFSRIFCADGNCEWAPTEEDNVVAKELRTLAPIDEGRARELLPDLDFLERSGVLFKEQKSAEQAQMVIKFRSL